MNRNAAVELNYFRGCTIHNPAKAMSCVLRRSILLGWRIAIPIRVATRPRTDYTRDVD